MELGLSWYGEGNNDFAIDSRDAAAMLGISDHYKWVRTLKKHIGADLALGKEATKGRPRISCKATIGAIAKFVVKAYRGARSLDFKVINREIDKKKAEKLANFKSEKLLSYEFYSKLYGHKLVEMDLTQLVEVKPSDEKLDPKYWYVLAPTCDRRVKELIKTIKEDDSLTSPSDLFKKRILLNFWGRKSKERTTVDSVNFHNFICNHVEGKMHDEKMSVFLTPKIGMGMLKSDYALGQNFRAICNGMKLDVYEVKVD